MVTNTGTECWRGALMLAGDDDDCFREEWYRMDGSVGKRRKDLRIFFECWYELFLTFKEC